MNRLTRNGTAEPVSRDQILRRERGQENTSSSIFPCLADHEQDCQPYPVDPYSYYDPEYGDGQADAGRDG